MARYDKDTTINPPKTEKHIGKPKGEMSIHEAAAMEMPEQHIETSRPGTSVHGFGDGQVGMHKPHTESGRPRMLVQSDTSERAARMELPMQGATPGMGARQRSAGESVTQIVEMIFQLPFHAQLGVIRMIAPRVLGAMDARDQESFLRELRAELDKVETSEESTEARGMNDQDFQGT